MPPASALSFRALFISSKPERVLINAFGHERDQKASAGEALTLWTRAVDDVVVKVSIHRRGKIASYSIRPKGDETFAAGDRQDRGDEGGNPVEGGRRP